MIFGRNAARQPQLCSTKSFLLAGRGWKQQEEQAPDPAQLSAIAIQVLTIMPPYSLLLRSYAPIGICECISYIESTQLITSRTLFERGIGD